MTLYELWLLIVRRWKLIVFVPLVCMVACLGGQWAYDCLQETEIIADEFIPGGHYTATARIVTNSRLQTVVGYASSEGRQYLLDYYGGEMPEEPDMSITASGNADTMTVSIVVKGSDGAACVQAANSVAESANRDTEAAFPIAEEAAGSTLIPYLGKVEFASTAKEKVNASEGEDGEIDTTGRSTVSPKLALIALLGGLFVAICIAVVLDMKKRPIKTAQGAQDAVEIPVLEILPAASGERLLANTRFAAKKDDLSSAYVVPVGDVEAAQIACDMLSKAGADEGSKSTPLAVECGSPLGKSMQSAYEARKSDAVLVSVRQWADTLPQLESTVAELKLADANLLGLVFVKDKLA